MQLLEDSGQLKGKALSSDIALDLLFLAIPILDSPELVLANVTLRLLHAHFQVSSLPYLMCCVQHSLLYNGTRMSTTA